MPFALIFLATLFIIVGFRGTQSTLFCLMKSDFTGQANFFYWLAAIMILGMIGYVPSLKKFSDSFLVLVLIAIFLAHKGFFNQFQSALGTTATAAPTNAAPAGQFGSGSWFDLSKPGATGAATPLAQGMSALTAAETALGGLSLAA